MMVGTARDGCHSRVDGITAGTLEHFVNVP